MPSRTITSTSRTPCLAIAAGIFNITHLHLLMFSAAVEAISRAVRGAGIGPDSGDLRELRASIGAQCSRRNSFGREVLKFGGPPKFVQEIKSLFNHCADDGEAAGPVMTDVLALLGRGALFRAPFRNSISRACRPTRRSSAAIFAS